MDREYILRLLHAQVNINGHIVGAAVGSGMTAKYAVMGGSDFVMALSAGKYRVMGRSTVLWDGALLPAIFVMEIVIRQ